MGKAKTVARGHPGCRRALVKGRTQGEREGDASRQGSHQGGTLRTFLCGHRDAGALDARAGAGRDRPRQGGSREGALGGTGGLVCMASMGTVGMGGRERGGEAVRRTPSRCEKAVLQCGLVHSVFSVTVPLSQASRVDGGRGACMALTLPSLPPNLHPFPCADRLRARPLAPHRLPRSTPPARGDSRQARRSSHRGCSTSAHRAGDMHRNV